jgi:hypothetical protein
LGQQLEHYIKSPAFLNSPPTEIIAKCSHHRRVQPSTFWKEADGGQQLESYISMVQPSYINGPALTKDNCRVQSPTFGNQADGGQQLEHQHVGPILFHLGFRLLFVSVLEACASSRKPPHQSRPHTQGTGKSVAHANIRTLRRTIRATEPLPANVSAAIGPASAPSSNLCHRFRITQTQPECN